jgi:SAM-dependent methyltransferase
LSPRDVPTDETVTFLRGVLPSPPARLLEVGCGRGDLAVRLVGLGYAVTALDLAPEAIGHARAAGLDAVEADFLVYDAEPFDVVLFSRSLHHINPLHAAVARAADLTRPGGMVIGEEFARERIDAETAAWQADVEALLGEVGLLPEVEGRPADDPLARWHQHHAHHQPPLATGADMLAAMEERFELLRVDEHVPYHYRYAADRLPDTRLGLGLTRLLLEIERRRVSASGRPWAGLRFVGRARGSSRAVSSPKEGFQG